MDVEAGFAFGASAGLLCGAFCWISSLDSEETIRKTLNDASNHTKSSRVTSKRRLRRFSNVPTIGLKDLLYGGRTSNGRRAFSRRHLPLSDMEKLDQLYDLKQSRMSEDSLIHRLRDISASEREERIFFEQTANAEKSLRRECEEQIAIYSTECSRLKETVARNERSLLEKNLLIDDLQTKLAAVESILKLLSPDASAPSASATAPSSSTQESIAALSEERDFLRQENDELRAKLLEERKRAREEREKLERQIAQYNLFLMMGGANNTTDSANSPNASPFRAANVKFDSSSAASMGTIPVMPSLMESTS